MVKALRAARGPQCRAIAYRQIPEPVVTKRFAHDVAASRHADAETGQAVRAHKVAKPVRRERPSKWTCPRCGTRKLLRGDRAR